MSGFDIIIPARYESSRLPGKPLLDIGGKPLVQRVWEQAARSGAERVIVATDDERISDTVTGFGGEVEMTAASHPSGTDRIAEVVTRLGMPGDRIIVNLQGDEPFLPPTMMDRVAQTLEARTEAVMSTACHPFENDDGINDPNAVKVVLDGQGYALLFSRSAIPWCREGSRSQPVFRHIGLYAYRAGFISEYSELEQCDLEKDEQLEQLRVLWHGRKIAVCEVDELPGPGIDTDEDLVAARAALRSEEGM